MLLTFKTYKHDLKWIFWMIYSSMQTLDRRWRLFSFPKVQQLDFDVYLSRSLFVPLARHLIDLLFFCFLHLFSRWEFYLVVLSCGAKANISSLSFSDDSQSHDFLLFVEPIMQMNRDEILIYVHRCFVFIFFLFRWELSNQKVFQNLNFKFLINFCSYGHLIELEDRKRFFLNIKIDVWNYFVNNSIKIQSTAPADKS